MENEEPQNVNADSNENTYATISHLTPLAACLLPALGWILGPLIWWALMKDKSPAVNLHGKEVLNFAISYTIYTIVATFLVFLVIGIPILFGLAIAMLIFVIVGTIKAANGKLFKYPLTIRIIK